MGTTSTPGLVLRDLPISARLVLTVFLLSVGLGYVSALVQLHFKHAGKGEFLPNANDAIRIFHGGEPKTKIEQLIDADPKLAFSKSGQMRAAFTTKCVVPPWRICIENCAKRHNISKEEATKRLEKEREGERLAMLAWVRSGADERQYDDNAFPFPKDWKADQPITKDFVDETGKNVRIQSMLKDRCVECHQSGAQADKFPLDTYVSIKKYLEVKNTRMDADSLAQTTHVHLLGFSMLYGLTGLILAFSSYPILVRCLICPLPLVAQIVDIGCWWLAREAKPYGPMFASVIPISGGVVALGLLSHIMLGLVNMYDWKGRFVLLILFAGAGAGGFFYLKPIIEAQINQEKSDAQGGVGTDKVTDDQPKKDMSPGKGPDEKLGKIERLIMADRKLKLNGKGQMVTPFDTESEGWDEAIEKLMEEKKITKDEAKKTLFAEREGERLAVSKWVQAGGPKKAYDDDSFALPADWNKAQPITRDFVVDGGKAVKISSILKSRCVVCHGPDGAQGEYPLDKYEDLKKYIPDAPAKK